MLPLLPALVAAAPVVASWLRAAFLIGESFSDDSTSGGGPVGSTAWPAPGASVDEPPPADWTRWGGARPEPLGAPENTILAVSGLSKVPPEARAALLQVAGQLGIPVDALALIIESESGWNPAADNKDPLTPATGLIQLTKNANYPGFTTADAIQSIKSMSAADQIHNIVLGFYQRYGAKAVGTSPGHLYMLNFLPAVANASEDKVLAVRPDGFHGKPAGQGPGGETSSNTITPSVHLSLGSIYSQNWGFDTQDKGYFTIGDVYARIERLAAATHGQRIAIDGTILPGYGAAKVAAGNCGLDKYSSKGMVGGLRSMDWGAAKMAGGGGWDDQRRGDPRGTNPPYAGVNPFEFYPMATPDPSLADDTYPYDELSMAWAQVPRQVWAILSPAPSVDVADAQGWIEICAEPDVPMTDQPNLSCLASTHTAGGPDQAQAVAIIKRGIVPAIMDGTADPPTWVQVQVGPYTFCVTAEPLTVAGLRLPTSTTDAIAVAKHLGALPLTPQVAEARWNTPGVRRVVAQPLAGGARGNDPDQVLRYNAAIGPNTGVLTDGFQKEVVIIPTLQRSGRGAMAQYGFRKPDGSMYEHGGPSNHDEAYKDYSDTPNYMGRQGLRQEADGSTTQVDMLDVIAAGDPHLGGPLPAWLVDQLRGGEVGA